MNALPAPATRFQVAATFTLPDYSSDVVYEVPVITDVFPLEPYVREVLRDMVGPYKVTGRMVLSRIEIIRTLPTVV